MPNVGNIWGSIRMKTAGLTRDLATANKKVSGFTTKSSSGFKRMTRSLMNMRTAIVGLGTITVGLGIGKAVKEFTSFEDALLDLQKVMTDAEGNAKDFIGTVEALSNKFAVASSEVFQSAAHFKQAGFGVHEAFSLVEQSLTLVRIGEVEAARASELLIATLKGFKAPASEAARLVNVLNAVSNKYATNINELASGMAIISPIAKLMGFSFEETAGLLTPIIEVFRSGTEAGNALKIGLLRLIDDNQQVVDALHNIGVAQIDVNGKLRSGKDILKDVQKAFLTLDPAMKVFIAQQLAGARQAARLLEVLNGHKKVVEITKVALEDLNSAEKELAIRLAATSTALGQVNQNFKNTFRQIGGFFNPAILKAADLSIRFMNSFKSGGRLEAFTILVKSMVKGLEALAKVFLSIGRAIFNALDATDRAAENFKRNFGAGKFDQEALNKATQRQESLVRLTGTQGLVTSAVPLIDFMASNTGGAEAFDTITEKAKLTKEQIDEIVDSVFDVTKDLVATGESGSKVFKTLQNATQGWGNSFSRTLTDMFFGAETSFRNIAESFARMITEMIIQLTVIEPLMKSILGFLTPAVAGSFNLVGSSQDVIGMISPTDLVGKATGGVIPGLRGQPMPIMAHGGERLLSASQDQRNNQEVRPIDMTVILQGVIDPASIGKTDEEIVTIVADNYARGAMIRKVIREDIG